MGDVTDTEVFQTMVGRHFQNTAEQIVMGVCDILKNGNDFTYRFNPERSFEDKIDPDGSYSVAYYDMFIAEKVPVAGVAIVKANGRIISSVAGCVTRPHRNLDVSGFSTDRQPHTDAAVCFPFAENLVRLATTLNAGSGDGSLSEASHKFAKCVKLVMFTRAPS